jgi:hypothetical protein
MVKDIYDSIKVESERVFNFWQNPRGWAPKSVTEILSVSRLDWLEGLTNTLRIWIDIEDEYDHGELLLANANLGALVEGWLKLFYCVYYEDYRKKPHEKKDKMIKPNDLKFENLKQFSRDILWEKGSDWDKWIERIQFKRNAIHAFNSRDIGDKTEFESDLMKFHDLIKLIDGRLPYPFF